MSSPLATNRWRPLQPLAAGALAAALAACGGGAALPTASPFVASPRALPQVEELSSAGVAPTLNVRPDARKSWMDSHAKGPLAYVSDSELDDVFVFTWPKLRLIGNLSGLHNPQGMCVDRSGNVWIANTNKSEMLEFAHAGIKPIKILADPGQYPVGCAMSPGGDLAVTNIVSKKHGQYGSGSLSIYKAAQGRPAVFSDNAFSRIYFDGYDKRGNLFFDGQNASLAFTIAEFDGKTFTPLTVSGATINFPGAVQVTGKHVNVEDQLGSEGTSVMYQTTLSATTLTVVATAQLLDSVDCVESYIYGTGTHQQLICPDTGTPGVEVYKYPAGGDAARALYRNVFAPTGAVVSL